MKTFVDRFSKNVKYDYCSRYTLITIQHRSWPHWFYLVYDAGLLALQSTLFANEPKVGVKSFDFFYSKPFIIFLNYRVLIKPRTRHELNMILLLWIIIIYFGGINEKCFYDSYGLQIPVHRKILKVTNLN